jgi:hypothetical protein
MLRHCEGLLLVLLCSRRDTLTASFKNGSIDLDSCRALVACYGRFGDLFDESRGHFWGFEEMGEAHSIPANGKLNSKSIVAQR